MERRANLRLVLPIFDGGKHKDYLTHLHRKFTDPLRDVKMLLKSKIIWLIGGRDNLVTFINSVKQTRANMNDITTGEPYPLHLFDFRCSHLNDNNYIELSINLNITNDTFDDWSKLVQYKKEKQGELLWYDEIVGNALLNADVEVLGSNIEILGDTKTYKIYCELIQKEAISCEDTRSSYQ